VPTASFAAASPLAQADRRPDVLAGPSVQVIYAHAAGVRDDFGAMAANITTDVATGNAWFLRQDPTRAPRWDLFPFPGCDGIGRLDVADVTLPGAAGAYAPLTGRFSRIRDVLLNAPYGFDSAYKKYLVYYDSPVEDENICGQGGARDPAGQGYAIIYVRTCGMSVGDGGMAAAVTFHELLHTFGLVGRGAPHECDPPQNGHTCDTRNDIMYPATFGEPIDALQLDPGRDDYWGAGPVDGRQSPFLVRLDAPHPELTVTHAGTGGLVESDVPGVFCTQTCTSAWEVGTEVALDARPAPGQRFVGWSGACTGRDACFVSVNAATEVIATFGQRTQTLRVVVSGRGRVSSTPVGVSCPGACAAAFVGDSAIRLTAKAARGYRFAGWTSGCRGARACRVTLRNDVRVGAKFVRA
jgi:hypothetical protein